MLQGMWLALMKEEQLKDVRRKLCAAKRKGGMTWRTRRFETEVISKLVGVVLSRLTSPGL